MLRSLMSERRQTPRIPVRLLVQHKTQGDESVEVDYASDLSTGGIFIRTARPAAPNATIHVQFSPDRSSQMVEAFCRVARVTPEGMAAAFVHIDTASQAALTTALR